MQEFGKHQKVVIGMVGLPARGKTFISRKVNRYLNWLGFSSKVFNIGNYRRELCGTTDCKNNFFDPNNQDAVKARNECARLALEDLTNFLKNEGDVGIYDGTNTTKSRRLFVTEELQRQFPGSQLFWIESICNDDVVVKTNIKLTKLNNPDYHNVSPSEATKDFLKRIEMYQKVYEPIEDSEKCSYIKLIDIGNEIVVSNVNGFLQSKVVQFVMNLHIYPRPIYFMRHGESIYNQQNRMGGDSELSAQGILFATQVGQFFKKEFNQKHYQRDGIKIFTSSMRRTIETAKLLSQELDIQYISIKNLDEINAGVFDSMTYDEIRQQHPIEYNSRIVSDSFIINFQQNKLTYRYPRGESYIDLISRIEPVIFEIERSRQPVIVIGHLANTRCLYGYFNREEIQNIPNLNVPLHCVIKLIPETYYQKETRYLINENTGEVEEQQGQNIQAVKNYIQL